MHHGHLHLHGRVHVFLHAVHLDHGPAARHHMRHLSHRRRRIRRPWNKRIRRRRRRRVLLCTGPAATHGHVQSFSGPDEWQFFITDRPILFSDRGRRRMWRLPCQCFGLPLAGWMRRRRHRLQQQPFGIKDLCGWSQRFFFCWPEQQQWHMPLQRRSRVRVRSNLHVSGRRWRRHRRQRPFVPRWHSAHFQHQRLPASVWRRRRRCSIRPRRQHHLERNSHNQGRWRQRRWQRGA
jgi:hypothetical protein